MTTQRRKILKALTTAPGTNVELAAETGVPRKHVAAVLSLLMRNGTVRRCGEMPKDGLRGRPELLYSLTYNAPVQARGEAPSPGTGCYTADGEKP